ncbi:hypothetical protein JCM15519_01510 [Fundidesulfovibrio butyratiphilus]
MQTTEAYEAERFLDNARRGVDVELALSGEGWSVVMTPSASLHPAEISAFSRWAGPLHAPAALASASAWLGAWDCWRALRRGPRAPAAGPARFVGTLRGQDLFDVFASCERNARGWVHAAIRRAVPLPEGLNTFRFRWHAGDAKLGNSRDVAAFEATDPRARAAFAEMCLAGHLNPRA